MKVLCWDPPPPFRDQVLFQMVARFGNLVVQVEHQLPAEPPKGRHSGLHYGLSAQSAHCTSTELLVACILLQAFPSY